MTSILVTGGGGFLGRNLVAHLRARNDCETLIFDQGDSPTDLERWLGVADVVFHLAGVNRPKNDCEFEIGNTGLSERICALLRQARRRPKIVFASSIQAELQNPYGISKRKAECTLRAFGTTEGASVRIYRLKNLFGKWCRPNYNSVTATFCHNIANDLPISISDPDHEVELSYVDDVVAAFLEELSMGSDSRDGGASIASYRIRLGDLAGRIQAFHDMRTSLTLPDFSDRFNQALYATYLSYVPAHLLQQDLEIRCDGRGSLAEFIKSKHFGQIFVSRTKPGVTRGNHYHHTKAEKFLVVEGEGIVRMRQIESAEVVEYRVYGEGFQVIDIPPGYTHSIESIGPGELVTLFWASESFDPSRPDTWYLPVLKPAHNPVPVTT